MKELTLTIIIDAPISTVFAFTTNPANTHLWITGMLKEESNKFPANIGTVYRNTSDGSSWDEYVVVELEPNKLFTLKRNGSGYRVRYSYRTLSPNETELTYHEWMIDGDLNNPFNKKYLQKLKALIEKRAAQSHAT